MTITQLSTTRTPSRKELEDFIRLPYEDKPVIYVSMHRVSAIPEVTKVAQELGFTVKNTAKERNGYPYVGKITWYQAVSLNLQAGYETASPREFKEFLLLLDQGIKETRKVYNGN